MRMELLERLWPSLNLPQERNVVTSQNVHHTKDERTTRDNNPCCQHISLRLLSITGHYVCAECGDVIGKAAPIASDGGACS
jgi:hypothetical protein